MSEHYKYTPRDYTSSTTGHNDTSSLSCGNSNYSPGVWIVTKQTPFFVSHPYTFAGFYLTSVCLSIDMPEHSIGRIPLVRYGVHNRPRAKLLSLWLSHKNTAEGWWHVFEHVISALCKTTEGNILLRNCSFKAQETYWRTCFKFNIYLRYFSCNSLWIRHKLDNCWLVSI